MSFKRKELDKIEKRLKCLIVMLGGELEENCSLNSLEIF